MESCKCEKPLGIHINNQLQMQIQTIMNFVLKFFWTKTFFDAPPSSLMDSIASPKIKTMERGVGARSLARNISG